MLNCRLAVSEIGHAFMLHQRLLGLSLALANRTMETIDRRLDRGLKDAA